MTQLNNITLTNRELEIVWLSLLCAGNGRIPHTVDYGQRVELIDEAQVTARELAVTINKLIADSNKEA